MKARCKNCENVLKLRFAGTPYRPGERRVMRPAGVEAYVFEGYTLDLRRGCLRNVDGEVELRPKSFEMLRHLVENAGRLISKDELAETLWRGVIVADQSLTRCICLLYTSPSPRDS